MSRLLLVLLAAALLMAIPKPVHGSHVIVPDDVPGVQAAVDGAADTIVVRESVAPESVHVTRPVVLRPWEEPAWHGLALPELAALTLGAGPAGTCDVRGFRVLRGVRLMNDPLNAPTLALESCVIEAGGIQLGPSVMGGTITARGCIVRGGVTGLCWSASLVGNAIFGGVALNYENFAAIVGNTVTGPADAGVDVVDNDGQGTITRNTIAGCAVGIRVRQANGTAVSDNVIADCAGAGIRTEQGMGLAAAVHRNRIRGGGFGLELAGGTYDVRDNVIEDTGADGIRVTSTAGCALAGNRVLRAAGHGAIVVDVQTACFARNTLIACAGGGAELDGAVRADSNVIAACGGPGLLVQTSAGSMRVRRNTLVGNDGAGLDLGGGASDSVCGNLSAHNAGVGLHWRGAAAPALGCDDWWANAGGATSGVTPAPTDVELDPLFCDEAARDLHLSAISPLLALACGPVGALGVGCAWPADAGPRGAAPAAFEAWPRPAAGGVAFAWSPAAQAGRLDVFDARGARVWTRVAESGSTGARWDGAAEDGAACAPGVYFARLSRGADAHVARVVLAR